LSALYIFLGICSGILSGFMGIGGGIVVIPALVYVFGFSQHQAQGTTLALMVPPIGLLAAWKYYQEGYVDFHAAILIALGFLAGSFLGAGLSVTVSNRTLSLNIWSFVPCNWGAYHLGKFVNISHCNRRSQELR